MTLTSYAFGLSMTLLALAFATGPLVVSYRAANRGYARLPLVASIAAVLMAIALYAVIGRPDMDMQDQVAAAPNGATARASAAAESREKIGSVAALLAGLEQRMQNNPDDGGGWLLLAKSYDHMGRPADARDAYYRAVALGVTDDLFAAGLTHGNDANDLR